MWVVFAECVSCRVTEENIQQAVHKNQDGNNPNVRQLTSG